ncbi:TPA: prefoldin subunit alpha [Candidatus Micrarchaeota archaeon]|nr:prefoldin subunit alpha [Candidatus Micrarchaeota archaeon]
MKLEEAVRAIDQQIQVLTAILQDTEAAIAALKSLKEKGEGLVPVGAGVFIPVRVEEDRTLVNVGAGVFLEKNVDDAVSLLEKRKESVKKALEQAKRQRIRLIEQARRVSK